MSFVGPGSSDAGTPRTEVTAPLPDGTYEVFILDASEVDGGDGSICVSATVIAGAFKSEVVDVTASGITSDPLDLLGMPGTLHVINGAPRLTVDG